jgi:hypothetical protein
VSLPTGEKYLPDTRSRSGEVATYNYI